MNLSLPRFAIERPITVVMISVCMLVLGVIAWNRMPLKFLPEIDQPFVGVSIVYPGASPQQVEQELAIPVEGEFKTIAGMRQIRTISNSDGCFVSMLFDLDVDMTLATADVRDRMERLKLVLPKEVDRMMIQRFNSQSIPVMALGVFKAGDQEHFVHQVRTILEPRIRRVDGVADVQVRSPVREREVLVEFEQETLRSMNLGLAQVINELRQGSLNVSVGELEEGVSKYLVRATGEFRELEDIEKIVVGPNGLRLRDVARVRFGTREDPAFASLDGKGGAVMLVSKESEANTVSTCAGVRAALDEAMKLPAMKEVSQMVFFDQSELITGALDNLVNEGVYGAVMAVIVLFLFLHRIRPTIIVALTIPTSLVVVLVFMFFADMSLNLITMVSMIICVGMLLDNSIVIVENIIRHRQLGYDQIESSVLGAEEVGLAVVASTAATLVVFIPMYYLEAGPMAVFMEQLGLPMIVAQIGSLIIALTLIPLAMRHMRSREDTPVQRVLRWLHIRRKKSAQGDQPVIVQWIVRYYSGFLRLALEWRLATLAGLGALIALTYFVPYQHIGMRDMPKLDTREVQIDVEFDPNYGIDNATALFAKIEEELNKMREELAIKNILSFYGRDGGEINAYLYTEEDGPKGEDLKYDTEQAMTIIAERLGKRVPGAEMQYAITESGDSGGEQSISVRLRGDEMKVLEACAERFRTVMEDMVHLRDVRTDIQRTKQEVQIKIDEPRAHIAGVPPIIIAQTVDAALRGARLPEMKQGGREIPVWAQFREEDRASKDKLDNLSIMSRSGGLVPLNQLVDFDKATSPSAIQRVNGKNVVTCKATASTENLSAVVTELRAAIAEFPLPPGYAIDLGEQLEEVGESVVSFTSTMIMAVALIYIVMAALFESYMLPLSILTSVPLALGGAVWALFITGSQMDTVTFVGCVLMAGLIVNNGIVIVDHINNLRKTGISRIDAIIQGGNDRFRPVVMTAMTSVLGIVPMALATTGGAATFAGLGQALIGGMTVGTLLTLLIVPLFYTIFDDFQSWILAFLGSFRSTKAARAPKVLG